MTRRTKTLAAVAAAGALVLGTAGAAAAAPADQPGGGMLLVFSMELQPLDQYPDPQGCINMPRLAHIVANLTQRTAYAHVLPNCVGPRTWVLRPDYGVHTAGFGSVEMGS